MSSKRPRVHPALRARMPGGASAEPELSQEWLRLGHDWQHGQAQRGRQEGFMHQRRVVRVLSYDDGSTVRTLDDANGVTALCAAPRGAGLWIGQDGSSPCERYRVSRLLLPPQGGS